MPLKDVHQTSANPFNIQRAVEDGVIASSLIAVPAWSAWISEFNHILTTLSLLIGLAIGLHRLWRIFAPVTQNKDIPPKMKEE